MLSESKAVNLSFFDDLWRMCTCIPTYRKQSVLPLFVQICIQAVFDVIDMTLVLGIQGSEA